MKKRFFEICYGRIISLILNFDSQALNIYSVVVKARSGNREIAGSNHPNSFKK